MKNSFISAVVALIIVVSFQSAYADERGLTRVEINKVLEPLRLDINQCYLTNAGERDGGRLDLKIEIGRYGSIYTVGVSTGLRNKFVARKINGCVQEVVKQLAFPARKSTTIAEFSYVFQKTHAPGDGPQLSCWNQNGCPGQ